VGLGGGEAAGSTSERTSCGGGSLARIHGALAGGRDGGEGPWLQDGSVGFGNKIEVVPAAVEVEGNQP
jgi:hypothetical protein